MPNSAFKRLNQLYIFFSYAIFLLTSLTLALISLALIVHAFREIWHSLATAALMTSLLNAVGLLVISIAVFDVAKFLFEEEVVRGERELRAPREARQTLTKFLVIIVIAVSLEALVFIFQAGSEDFTLLLYPVTMLVAVVLLVIGLGYYQRLSLQTETRQTHLSQRKE